MLCALAAASAISVCCCFPFSCAVPAEGESHRVRPVLDAIHDRDTGKVRVGVNDGRVATATRSAVEVVLSGIGAVLFNPRTQVSYCIVLSSTFFSLLFYFLSH